MKRRVKLSFGERMREWRKARKELADEIKAKLKEEMEIKQDFPPQPAPIEGHSLVTSPTEVTEMKTERLGPVSNPSNHIEAAINRLREQAKAIE